jgi:hypothetical protein
MNRLLAVFLMLFLTLTSLVAADVEIGQVDQFHVAELSFTGPSMSAADAPITSVDFYVDFTHESGSPTHRIHAFWDSDGSGGPSGNLWKVRFCPTLPGRWYLADVVSDQPLLDQQNEGNYILAAASSHPGFWLVDTDSADGRWYKRSDGTHPYIVGNTHYDFLSRPNGREASTSSIQADVAASAGYFKKLRFSLFSFRSENASSTVLPFLDSNGNQTNTETGVPNPRFFMERVDAAVAEGFEHDLICDLVMAGTIGDQTADEEGFIKYVAARYGAYPNVWFTVGQEWNEKVAASHQKAKGELLRSYLAYEMPVSTHGTGDWNSSLNGDWHDHVIVQGKHWSSDNAADDIIANFAIGGQKPVVNDEASYDPSDPSTDAVIRSVSGCFAGGGYGTTGHKTASKVGGYFFGHATQNQSITVHPSIDELKFLRESIDQNITFWRMSPVGQADNSIFSGSPTRARALEWSGNEYVLVSDQSGSMTAQLPAGSSWTIRRYRVFAKSSELMESAYTGGQSYSFSTGSSGGGTLDIWHFKSDTAGGEPPVPPDGLVAQTGSGFGEVDLSWQDNSTDETAFQIDYSLSGTNNWSPLIHTLPANTTSFTATGLADQQSYDFRLRATSGGGQSSWSPLATASTAVNPQAMIVSPSDNAQVAPGEVVTLTGSGTALSWSYSGVTSGSGTGTSLQITVPLSATDGSMISVHLSGEVGSDQITLEVRDTTPVITTSSDELDKARAGQSYSDDLEADGGEAPLTWSVAAGTLPVGLGISGSEITGTPLQVGQFEVVFRVTDRDGDSSVQSLVLEVEGDGTTLPDQASTQLDTAVVVDVLANDQPAPGNVMELLSVGSPQNGSVSLVDGKVVYTPNAGFNGFDYFYYEAESASTSGDGILVDADLTTGQAAVGPLATVNGGSWDNGWHTGSSVNDGSRIEWDLGRIVTHGYAEITVFAYERNGNKFWDYGDHKINWAGIYEDATLQHRNDTDKAYVRTGQAKYDFSRIKLADASFGHLPTGGVYEAENDVGSTSDWTFDNETPHTVRFSWEHDSSGYNFTFDGPADIQRRYWNSLYPDFGEIQHVFIGCDKTYNKSAPGMRFTHVKIVDLDGGGTLPTLHRGVVRVQVGAITTPEAEAGADQQVEDANQDGTARVYLDGTASSDDVGIVGYSWKLQGQEVATGPTPSILLPLGTHIIELVVSDADGQTHSDWLTVVVFQPTTGQVVVQSSGSLTAGEAQSAFAAFNLENSAQPADYLVLVTVSELSAVVSASYGAQPMTLLFSAAEGAAKVSIWGLAMPEASATVDVNYDGNVYGSQYFAFAYLAGVDPDQALVQTASIAADPGTATGVFGFSDSVVAGDLVVVGGNYNANGSTIAFEAPLDPLPGEARPSASFSGAAAWEIPASDLALYSREVTFAGTERHLVAGIVLRADRSLATAEVDTDFDGTVDLIEDFLGTDKSTAGGLEAVLSGRKTEGGWEFNFTRSTDAQRPDGQVWWSSDLVQWQQDDLSIEAVDMATGHEQMKAVLSRDVPRAFFRIEVSSAE